MDELSLLTFTLNPWFLRSDVSTLLHPLLRTLASSEVLPSGSPGEVCLWEPLFLCLSSSVDFLSPEQRRRRRRRLLMEGLQLGRALCSCSQLSTRVPARTSPADSPPASSVPGPWPGSPRGNKTEHGTGGPRSRYQRLHSCPGEQRGLQPQSCSRRCVWRRCREGREAWSGGKREGGSL